MTERIELDYQNFDEIGDLIKVHFSAKVHHFKAHTKDHTFASEVDTCKGLGERLWATVLEVRKENDFPISLTNIIIVKLENQPIHQFDEATKQKIESGDICEFEDDGFNAAEFIKLVCKGE